MAILLSRQSASHSSPHSRMLTLAGARSRPPIPLEHHSCGNPYYNSPTPATQRFLDGNNFSDRAMECRNIWAKHKSDWQDRLAIAIDQAVVCLNRSAGCSLSLTFNCFDNPGADFQEGVSRLVELISQTSSRWEVVHFNFHWTNSAACMPSPSEPRTSGG